MEEHFTFQNITTLLFLTTYLIIFFVQKSQLKKQGELMKKYNKLLGIINIDEIEKYVELNKKSTELSYSNRLAELDILNNNVTKQLEGVQGILNSTSSNLEKTEQIKEKVFFILKHNQELIKSLSKLSVEEFEETQSTLHGMINGLKDKPLIPKIEKELIKIAKKYISLKEVEFDKYYKNS